MTIIEAIKSGKAFRRACWMTSEWLTIRLGEFWNLYDNETYAIDVNEVLADDWIVREE